MPRTRDRRLLAAAALILAVAVAVRLALVLATPDYRPTRDDLHYDQHARSIAFHGGYPLAYGRPSAYRPPAYPYLLAGVYLLVGRDAPAADRWLAARLVNVALGALIVAATGLLAALVAGRRVALVALALAALYLPLVFAGAPLMSEPLFVTLAMGAVLAALWQRRSAHRLRWAAAAGVLLGLAALTRTNAPILLLPLGLAVWGGPPRLSRRALAPVAALVAAAVLTVAPWTVRNRVELGVLVPVATQTGAALAGTYNEVSRHDPEDPWAWRPLSKVPDYAAIYDRKAEMPGWLLDERLAAAALDYIAARPQSVLEVGFWNTARLLDLSGRDRTRDVTGTLALPRRRADWAIACFHLVALLALAGALGRRARRIGPLVWSIPVLLALSVVFLQVETPRFRTPIDPFLLLLAALALTAAADRVRDRRAGRRSAARGEPARRRPQSAAQA